MRTHSVSIAATAPRPRCHAIKAALRRVAKIVAKIKGDAATVATVGCPSLHRGSAYDGCASQHWHSRTAHSLLLPPSFGPLAPPARRDKRNAGTGGIHVMGIASALFALAAATIVAVWTWLGASVAMPPSPFAAGQKLYCVSYAPFRGDQNPLGPDVPIDPRQIEADLAQLKAITDCVRTYAVDHGLDQIPEIARRHGMKVLQGVWVSN